tara:strand:- start:119 stop:253 length:135 start_codon:yes stop_codon:yes gene_type:complete
MNYLLGYNRDRIEIENKINLVDLDTYFNGHIKNILFIEIAYQAN